MPVSEPPAPPRCSLMREIVGIRPAWMASRLVGFEDRPGLAAYLDRCAARPAVRDSLAEAGEARRGPV